MENERIQEVVKNKKNELHTQLNSCTHNYSRSFGA